MIVILMPLEANGCCLVGDDNGGFAGLARPGLTYARLPGFHFRDGIKEGGNYATISIAPK
jgi:hypothetical protein